MFDIISANAEFDEHFSHDHAIQTKLYDGQRYQLLRYDLSFSSNFMFQKPL